MHFLYLMPIFSTVTTFTNVNHFQQKIRLATLKSKMLVRSKHATFPQTTFASSRSNYSSTLSFCVRSSSLLFCVINKRPTAFCNYYSLLLLLPIKQTKNSLQESFDLTTSGTFALFGMGSLILQNYYLEFVSRYLQTFSKALEAKDCIRNPFV